MFYASPTFSGAAIGGAVTLMLPFIMKFGDSPYTTCSDASDTLIFAWLGVSRSRLLGIVQAYGFVPDGCDAAPVTG